MTHGPVEDVDVSEMIHVIPEIYVVYYQEILIEIVVASLLQGE